MAASVGRYVSVEAEAHYRENYERARALWPEHTVERVETSFGTSQVLTLGEGDGAPVVLLHGASMTSLMWRPNLAAFEGRPVIAIDSIVDAGGSRQTAPVEGLKDLALSVRETLAGMGVDRADLIGLSYGGWTAAGVALHHPELVGALALLEPAATFHAIRWPWLLGFARSFVRRSPQRWDHLYASPAPADQISLLDQSRGFRPAMPLPGVFSDEELRSLTRPLRVILGERSSTTDPQRVRARLAGLGTGAEVVLVPGAGHMVSTDDPAAVNAALRGFLSAAE